MGISFHTNPMALYKEFQETLVDVPMLSKEEVKNHVTKLLESAKDRVKITIGIIYVNDDGSFAFKDKQKDLQKRGDTIHYIKMSIHDPMYKSNKVLRVIQYTRTYYTLYLILYSGNNVSMCTNYKIDTCWGKEAAFRKVLDTIW
jgi:hypothetical protein